MSGNISAEKIAKAKTLRSMGWSFQKIADHMGIASHTTTRKYCATPDDPEMMEVVSKGRKEFIDRYVGEAWDLIFKLNAILIEKVNKGESAFNSPKDVAIVQAIYVDKISNLQAGDRTPSKQSPIQINIMPPAEMKVSIDGDSSGIIEDTVSVYDEPIEVLSDGGGSGEWEDVCGVPEGNIDGG